MQSHEAKEFEGLCKKVNDHDALLESINKTLLSMDEKLEPIVETYRTVSKLGKWTMAFLIFVSVVIGILVECKKYITIK